MAAPEAGGVNERNIHFIEQISGKEWIGIDEAGRLYQVTGALPSLAYLFTGVSHPAVDPKVRDAIKVAFERKALEWKESGATFQEKREYYRHMIAALGQSKILSPENRELLINTWYEQRYQDLLKEGYSPFVAESMVTIEMSVDPYIPAQVKERILPQLVPTGVGGTYFIKNRQGETIAVFKPQDEEIEMPNNPKGKESEYDPLHPKRSITYRGQMQGTCWKKEVGAFLIDSESILGVPPTHAITVPFLQRRGSEKVIEKRGSLQRFVPGVSLDTMEYEKVKQLPAEQVQKVVALDILSGNADRNFGNVLFDEKEKRLHPIDHGFAFFDGLDMQEDREVRSEMNTNLLYLDQVAQPVHPDLAKWILSLDGDKMAERLQREGQMPESSIREFRVRLMVTQEALKRGYTLDKIAKMMMFAEVESFVIEKICEDSKKECMAQSEKWEAGPPEGRDKRKFLFYFALVKEKVIDQLKAK